MSRWEEVTYKAGPEHFIYGAMFFTTLAALSLMAVQMSVGETDIAHAYQPSLDAATKIDSNMGMTEAQANIDLHKTYAGWWKVAAMGGLGTGTVGAWLFTRTVTRWERVK